MRIRISWHKGEVFGDLKDTPTTAQLSLALPCTAKATTWGEEVYFPVEVRATLDPGAQQVVPPGTVCFWVEGKSLVLPFGPTPISEGNECRLVTKVNVLGKLEGDPRVLASINDGNLIKVEAVPDKT
ncbi:hypothetical protein HQ590_03680 [bacterium]|nr:hypothetical protein [bacterium]